jgi:hypothetical protein
MVTTTVGSSTSDSYVTVAEAETIISSSGLSTTAWESLSADEGIRTTGTKIGPFIPLTGVSDVLSFALEVDGTKGSDQTVAFPAPSTGTTPISYTIAEACTYINDHVTGITCVPSASEKLTITVSNPTDTLYINVADHSAYSIFGITVGTYIDTVASTKEYMLKLGAQLMGYLPLKGERVYTDQALDFPRTSQKVTTEIPVSVKEAQALITCLVVYPNIIKQESLSEDVLLPTAIQNSVVDKVQVAGIMTVSTSSSASASESSLGGTTTSFLASAANAFMLPIYLRMRPYLTQVRGGSLISPDDFAANLEEAV